MGCWAGSDKVAALRLSANFPPLSYSSFSSSSSISTEPWAASFIALVVLMVCISSCPSAFRSFCHVPDPTSYSIFYEATGAMSSFVYDAGPLLSDEIHFCRLATFYA